MPRIARAEAFFANTKAAIRHGGTKAYYSISTDHMQMPPFEVFRDAESYYAVLAHETTHYADTWTMPRQCYRSRKEAPSVGIYQELYLTTALG